MVCWLGGRVSFPAALHTQCTARVVLCGRECVYQHTVLRDGRAILIGMRYAVKMRRHIVHCILGVQYVLLGYVADAARRRVHEHNMRRAYSHEMPCVVISEFQIHLKFKYFSNLYTRDCISG